MTEPVQIALIASIAPTLVAVGGVVLILRKQSSVAAVTTAAASEAREAATQAVLTAEKAKGAADVVHNLVNSRLTEEIKAKEAALARIQELETKIRDRYKER